MTTRPRLARRSAAFAAIAVAGALTLTACGSDDNSDKPASGETTNAANPPGGSSSAAAPAKLDCPTGTLQGAGSSAQKNAMDEWVKAFQQKCSGAKVEYNGNGSGAGRQAFFDSQVAFAGSDASIADADVAKGTAACKGTPAINLPMVTGPIAVAYNVSGVKDLVLDAKTIAGIFAGQIKTWDAAEIKALNPKATLPSTPIQAVHRSDKSGTTENFTKYLKAAGGDAWAAAPSQDWPSQEGQSAKGSDGVANVVKTTAGAIGYMEGSFAENAGLGVAQINTGAAAPVKLTPEAAGKAVSAAKITGTGNDLKLQLDYATKAEGAYPIVLVTYEIACEKGTPADKLPLVKSFLTYTSSEEGQSILAKNGYAPLPAEIATKVRTAVAALS
ncbi:phosphate ABC transporter substrate-binding protein PstS [Yinghuangia seranimata]|uniref:phosphate ABC transporter substrate-binding protein PstS n=1 Tax=Yinghuangia seranimata TaxID=408067 RepID=UPI00248C104F|nr:phosphate ABC transporter substrate-binding protein PstS [Yinghuangia seranimata]MDI2131734.1 phosphate ABC transporter substrate-binding protein PstS [Yinghuangia seranimata]